MEVFGLANRRDPPDIESLGAAGLPRRLKPEIEVYGDLGFGEDDAVELAQEFEDD
jgi:hypothetical protein